MPKRVPVSIKVLKNEHVELDKRTYLPAILMATCPTCGKQVKKDLRQAYLSYPTTNSVERVTMVCFDSDYNTCTEFEVRVIVRLTVEEAPMPKKLLDTRAPV